MFTFHVLFIARNRYEVCSDDGRYSREFTTRKEADICADCLSSGKTDLDAMAEVVKHRARKAKASEASKLRSEAMKSLGMKRNTNGSWE